MVLSLFKSLLDIFKPWNQLENKLFEIFEKRKGKRQAKEEKILKRAFKFFH